MKVVLHVPDPEYASQLLTEQIFYILKNRVEKYVTENNLGDKEKVAIYERLLEEIKGREKS